MKILFIASNYAGGNGAHIMRVSGMLRKYGFEVSQLEAPHVPIKNLKNPSYALLGAIKTLVSRQSYDIVHAFNVPSALAMRCTRAQKRVLSIHGVFSDQIGMIHTGALGRIAKLAESVAIRWADKLATDSEASRKRYSDMLGVDFECTISPLDTSAFKYIPDVPKRRQVVYVGRDSYEKGIDVLREAENAIDANVVYCTGLPWTDAMTRLKESSVIVIPSRIESMPQVILEAFYLKVPIVATHVGGIPEIITNNSDGLLVPPENPAKLAQSINKLLDDKDLSNTLARNGYNHVLESLTCNAMLSRYVNFYVELLES